MHFDSIALFEFNKLFLRTVNVAGILLIFAGIALIGFQVFFYLKQGEWVELSLLDIVFIAPNKFIFWLDHPSSWLGLHKIIYGAFKFIPLSLSSILLGSWIRSDINKML